MRVLLVGDANSIFFVHYVKALKKQMDVEVHVYSPTANTHDYADYPYDKVYFDDYEQKRYSRIKYLSSFYNPYVIRTHFGKFLKRNGIRYEIMHFHWVLPSWVICPQAFRKYADKVCYTFWGGEFATLQLLKSHAFYLKKLKNLLKDADAIIGNLEGEAFLAKYPFVKEKTYNALYGSSIIDGLSESNESKADCKKHFGIDADKITVMPGYSGKSLHNQDKILKEIITHNDFEKIREKVHFVFPMTRGAEDKFLKHLEAILVANKCQYTIIKGTYLPDDEVVKLRKATDIMFQLSDFDALSSSIKECLCAGTVLISGDWFPAYGLLKEWNFKYFEVRDIKEGVVKFYDVMEKFDYYCDLVKDNAFVGENRFSWKECIKNWAEVYETMTKNKS